jgi:hypothetical protein
MKPILFLVLTSLAAAAAVAPPAVQWTQEGMDLVMVARPTRDGGFILGGSIADNFWIRKLSNDGSFAWQTAGQRSGHDFEDLVVDVQPSADRGYVALVETDPAVNGFGDEDYQVIFFDANGGLQWQRTFGASSQDFPKLIRLTPDGGFIFAGSFREGTNGNLTGVNYGETDWRLVRLDAQGNKITERAFGGASYDILTALTPTSDGGFVLVGHSSSPASGNKTSPNLGGDDIWVVRLDAEYNKNWDRAFGGVDNEYAVNVWETNGIVVVAGYSASNNTGNKTNLISGAWILGLDAHGNKLWERSVSGRNEDVALQKILPTNDGGFFLAVDFSRRTPTFCCELFHRIERIGPENERTWELVLPAGGYLESLERTPDGGLIGAGGTTAFKTWPDALDAPPRLNEMTVNEQGHRFLLTGTTNTDYAIERSMDLQVWGSVLTNRLVLNPTPIGLPRSAVAQPVFYRARVLR